MMLKVVMLLSLGCVAAKGPLSSFDTGCYDEDDKGKGYRGLVTSTTSGRACQVWTKDKPHTISTEPSTENGVGNHNYCRNPDGSEDKPWCFTMDPSPAHKKETCEVPKCEGMARDFKDEARTLSTKMAPSFDCACLATLHALGGSSFLQQHKNNATKSNSTQKMGKVVNGKY